MTRFILGLGLVALVAYSTAKAQTRTQLWDFNIEYIREPRPSASERRSPLLTLSALVHQKLPEECADLRFRVLEKQRH